MDFSFLLLSPCWSMVISYGTLLGGWRILDTVYVWWGIEYVQQLSRKLAISTVTFAKFLLEYSSVNFARKKMRVYGLLLILEKKILVHSKPVQIITLEFIAFMYMIFFYIYIIIMELSTLFELKYMCHYITI